MLFQHCLLLLLISASFCEDTIPRVETPLGPVVGYIGTSYNGRNFLAFEGIPYAKPPIGDLRFEEPQPVEPWNETLNATVRTQCVQTLVSKRSQSDIIQSEDCLHVSVYVPREEISPEDKLDVIIHIHGGAFLYGSAFMYCQPDFIMDKDVIFVTFNYRLGIFGFLSTEDDVVPGNNGLKDQVLLLQWVQENIASFGGNPDSVTIYGLSAGSGSVHLHYLSDLSQGLFHRGFSQSGLALNPWATVEEPLNKAKKLADSLGCPTEFTQDLVYCLKQIPTEELAEKLLLFFGYKILPADPFGPVVEKGGAKPFLKNYPYELLSQGQTLDVPLLASNAIHDGMFPAEYLLDDLDNIDQNLDELAPIIFDFNYTLDSTLWANASESIKEFYFGDDHINLENFMELVQACSDRWFLDDAETALKLQAYVNESPVFYYIFAYPGDNNENKIVPHGAERKYIFGNVDPPTPLTENELKMKDVLLDMLVAYANTGVPSFNGVEWPPVTYEEIVYVNVSGFEDEDIILTSSQELTNRKFWQSLHFAENENLFT